MGQTLTCKKRTSAGVDMVLAVPYVGRSAMKSHHLIVLLLAAAACTPVVASLPGSSTRDPSADRLIGPSYPGATARLNMQDSSWVDATFTSLSPRERVAQLIMPWVPGEYAAVGSPEYEQVRGWVQDDKVGGLVLSIGLPLSYAAKLNHMQRIAKVPLLVASDMENGTGMRLGGSYALPSLL